MSKNSPLPEIDVAIWIRPHRAWGHMVEITIDDMLLGDGVPCGRVQSLEHARNLERTHQLDHDKPHTEFQVSLDQMRALVTQIDETSCSLRRPRKRGAFGGSFFGLQVSQGFGQVTLVWEGDFEAEDKGILDLYKAVEQMAGIVNFQWTEPNMR